tara:strand:+ start:19 stop:537 length:519 start_codon:yes stop_codon:yes gene_type:complete
MFDNVKEETLDKVYDWISSTYYSPYPTWKPQSDGEYERAIHALNDMRSLYAGVGNNGWWEPERVGYLDELRDIIPYSMDQVLWKNEQIRRYEKNKEEAREEWEKWEGDDTWEGENEDEYFAEHAPDIVKMQGNKDGRLYEYTKKLFWESVEWFLDNYASDSEINEVSALIQT